MRQKKKILIISHDAGGANILAALINKYWKKFIWRALVFGPAKRIFQQQKVKIEENTKIKESNNIENDIRKINPDLVLTGTSWGSNIENQYLEIAKKNDIRTISFLDHWGNYKVRFGRGKNWRGSLPDYLMLGDHWAYKIALKEGIPQDKLILVENPYFEKMVEEAQKIEKRPRINNLRLLFLSQPVCTYSEYQVLKDILNSLKIKGFKKSWKLKIRLHPAEKNAKYSNLLQMKNYLGIIKSIYISDSKKNSLVDDCQWANIVIGINSVALFIAFLIGKKVISYLPKMDRIYLLPQKGIKKIKSSRKLLEEIRNWDSNEDRKEKQNNYHKTQNLFYSKINQLV